MPLIVQGTVMMADCPGCIWGGLLRMPRCPDAPIPRPLPYPGPFRTALWTQQKTDTVPLNRLPAFRKRSPRRRACCRSQVFSAPQSSGRVQARLANIRGA